MKKKAFTLIELFVVMAILVVMFLMTRNLFSTDNQIYYQGESCINNTYYAIKDLNNAALLGRSRALSGVYSLSGNTTQTPDRYTIILRSPSFYNNPQFPISGEIASGIIKALLPNQLNMLALGTFNSQTLDSTNVLSWAFLYRGTGDITKDIDLTGADAYGTLYLPIWGVNFPQASGYSPINGCASPNFFVTYNINTPYTNVTTLRVGFQTSSAITSKKMLLWPGQRSSGTIADDYTGAINFQVCNKSIKCKETFRIFFDTRVDDLFLQKCATFDSNLKCTARQGGDIN